jgi:hypothetical protein
MDANEEKPGDDRKPWLCRECESQVNGIEPTQGTAEAECDRCHRLTMVYRWYRLTAMDFLIRDGARLTMENERLKDELAALKADPIPQE